MFSSAIRRLVRAHQSIPTASYVTGIPSTASITASSRQFTLRSHRRRYSSSKPSSPPDDSTKVAPQQQTPSNTNSRTRADSDKRSVTRLSKRKAKDTAEEASTTRVPVKNSKDEEVSLNINLPSVPSTHHLHPSDIAISAFFSMHRPISVTAAVPSNSTPLSFNALFSPPNRSSSTQTRQPSDVMSTLASVVKNLEHITELTQEQQQEEQQQALEDEETDLRTIVTQASVSNAERQNKHLLLNNNNNNNSITANTNNSPLQFPAHLLSSKFKPFTPPPPPSPLDIATTGTTTSLKSGSPTTQKSYSLGVTIHSTTTSDGHTTYTAQIATPILETTTTNASLPIHHPHNHQHNQHRITLYPPPQRQSFLKHMLHRHQTYLTNLSTQLQQRGLNFQQRSRVFRAISVKRQRKLKMKKHKYKKLMKRTRNLRRRLDKL
ncbi:MAG: hypothetical protein M1812_004603 [Candelaria pacifica]|nr:MAG: hypothetical protein M1812_004603 [Candelaria pacifica]